MKTLRLLLIFSLALSITNCDGGNEKKTINAKDNLDKGVENNKTDNNEIESTDLTQNLQSGVPKAVDANFKKMYPGENDPDWEVDSNGNWESNFKIDGISYRADYSPDGEWIETESSIDKKDLPAIVKERIDKEYGDQEITEIERVEHHSKGVFFDVEFKKEGKNMDVEFKENGEIINL